MSHVLFFDVAASRFVTDKTTDEKPRVVRVAWWRDDELEPICRFVEPIEGMTIDPKTVPYHGLTLDRLKSDGVSPRTIIDQLELDAEHSTAIVSYNADFHWRQLHRLMNAPAANRPLNAQCAMNRAAPILAIPAMRPGGGFKSPSLREACEFFDLPGPSGSDPVEIALSTVRAVRGVWEACLEREQEKTP